MQEETLKIKVKYLADIQKIVMMHIGDWIDLRAAEDVLLEPMEYYDIKLGVAMELPEGYEAHIVPRSSTYKNFGILPTASVGIIDNSYCGDTDEWHFPAIALRKTFIRKGDRICQFRIMRTMKSDGPVELIEVDKLGNSSRGGLGSTGIK